MYLPVTEQRLTRIIGLSYPWHFYINLFDKTTAS